MSNDREQGIGLRELKRRATESAIETAAVRIALEESPDAVTVERICAEAFVSRSTFFNYFPSRDAAIYGRQVGLEPGERVDEILERWHDDLPLAIAIAVLDRLGDDHVTSPVAQMRYALVRKHPELGEHLSWDVKTVRGSIEAVVVDWLERHPGEIRLGDPRIDAAVAISIAMMLGDELYGVWLEHDGELPFGIDSIVEAYGRVRDRLTTFLAGPANG